MPYTDWNKQKDYVRRYNARRRFLYLLGKACTICGSTLDLQIDHIEPLKQKRRSFSLWSMSKERFDREIVKCQVLCKECHLLKTKDDMRTKIKPLIHGTVRGYRWRKCRCNECREAHNKQCRKTYHKMKENKTHGRHLAFR